MIAKHVAMRSLRKSDFSELVRYITDTQGSLERVGYIAVTNCHSPEPEMAALEVQATQQLNTRSKADKTYHLIISFRVGEDPSNEVLAAVERHVCDGLGFGEHQRVSAAHYDTDNVHLHVAINKVHPTKHTVHSPYFDHLKLPALCAELEQEFRLEVDNHHTNKRGSEDRAEDMERHAGEESLQGWIRRECLERLQAATTWNELHDTMREHGLEMRARGNGLIIQDAGGVQVKASSVARELSKQQLEKKLGPFQASQHREQHVGPKERGGYQKRPVKFKIDTTDLYDAYNKEQKHIAAARPGELASLRSRQTIDVEQLKAAAAAKRGAIKLLGATRLEKKILYALVSRSLRSELASIQDQHRKERRVVQRRYARLAWADWLKMKATDGSQLALDALRARESRQGIKGNSISAVGGQVGIAVPLLNQDGVTKKGTVIYSSGDVAIRDDGDKLQVSRGADRGGIHTALQLAHQRFGDQICVEGSAEFKARVVAAAAAQRLPITFMDPDLERRRQALLNSRKGNRHGGQDRSTADGRGLDVRGRSAAQNVASSQTEGPRPARAEDTARAIAGTGAAATVGGTGIGSARAVGGSGIGTTRAARGGSAPRGSTAGAELTTPRRKPDIASVGRTPPPFRKNRLRNLSELGLVHNPSAGPVLLPRDVPGHVEQQNSRPDSDVRRNVSGGRGIAGGDAAAQKFIAERERKKGFGFDIPNFTRYTSTSDNVVTYAGTRSVDGVYLALFARDGVVEVHPVDAASAHRLKRLKLGDPVTVTAAGTVRTKGRSR